MKARVCKMLVIAAVFLPAQVWGEGPEDVAMRFDRQRELYPQEKAYVHTDRSCYMGGDTVWYRVHVADASTHEPVSWSKYVYVELKTPDDSLSQRVKVMGERGVYAGYLALPQDIAEGDYTLTAYTNFMRSAGASYFPQMTLRIGNPLSTKFRIEADTDGPYADGSVRVRLRYVDRRTGRPAELKEMTYRKPDGSTGIGRNPDGIMVSLTAEELRNGNWLYVAFDKYAKYIRFPDNGVDYDVTFHPEGGYLVNGTACKVAFKAIGSQGLSRQVAGRVVDSHGVEVARIVTSHAGMGLFTLVPQPMERYYAECVDTCGRVKRFALPEAQSDASVLRVVVEDTTVTIGTVGRARDDLRLVVHQRGKVVCHVDNMVGEVRLVRRGIPSGVVHAVLFDGDWNPLSERLFYVGQRQGRSARVTTEKPAYSTREHVSLRVSLEGYGQREGNFSVSVSDARYSEDGSDPGLSAEMLLCSELSGHVEDPGYYFDEDNTMAPVALDLLLMTQGWRRYDVPSVVRGRYALPAAELEIGQELRGRLGSRWRDRPEQGALVNVIVPKYGYAGAFTTDSAGIFRCTGFDFPEDTQFLLQAFRSSGKSLFPNFRVFETYPETHALPMGVDEPAAKNEKTDESEEAADITWEQFVEQERLRYLYNGMSVTLDEVVVEGFKVKPPEDFYESIAFRSYDYREMEKEGVTSVEEILRKIAGLRLQDGNYSFRSYPTALYIDGVSQDGGQHTQDDFLTPYLPGGMRQKSSSASVITDEGKPDEGAIPGVPVHLNPGHSSATMGLGSTFDSQLDLIERIPFDMIKRVDFLQPSQAVIFGPNASGGAIMITTKRGSEIPEGADWRDYRVFMPLGYQQRATFYSPKYETTAERQSTVFDFRPTLYWNPCVAVDSQGKAHVDFYTSDSRNTAYHVRVAGLTADGEIIDSEYTVRVK